MALPMDRFLNLVYFFATEDAEQADKDKFDVRLHKPDARARRSGAAVKSGPWSAKAEAQSLNVFAAQITGKVATG